MFRLLTKGARAINKMPGKTIPTIPVANDEKSSPALQIIKKLFALSYSLIIFLFFCCGLALTFFAALELWHGLNPSEALPLRGRFNSVL